MKLRKIIASATLSVCLATSAVIATTGLNKTGANAATQTVATSGIVSTVTASGSNASVSYVTGKKQVSVDNAFTGLRLTGTTGSTFDLGEFKLDNNKMYWNGNVKDDTSGTYTGTNDHDKAANADNTKSYGSIFSFVYDPNVAASVTGDLEINHLYVTFTEVGNESNYVTMYVQDHHTGSGTGNDNGLLIRASATNNTTYGGERYRSTGTTLTEYARKIIKADGTATTPIDLVWDNEKAIAYSNTSFSSGIDGIGGAWGLRQFKAAKEDYVAGSKGQDEYTLRKYQPWSGFTDGATLKCTVKFDGVTDASSIIVTSFGGYDLTKAEQEIDTSEGGKLQISGNNPATVAANAEADIYAPLKAHRFGGSYATDAQTEVYYAGKKVGELTYGTDGKSTAKFAFNKEGVYTLKHIVGAETLTETIKCTGSQTYAVSTLAGMFVNTGDNATAAYGEKTIRFVNGKSQDATYKGIVLTGGSGATFTLDKEIDVTSFKWNSKDDFNSLFDFVIAPSGNTLAKAVKTDGSEWTMQMRELQNLTFIIEDSVHSEQKITLKYQPGEVYEDRTPPKSSVGAMATGQSFAAFRQVQGGKVVNKYMASVPKETGFNGTATKPTSVVYDYSKNSLYSDVVYSTATGDSYLIRDFSDGSYGPAWSGFSSGKVKITVQFGNLTEIGGTTPMADVYKTSLGLSDTPVAVRADGAGDLTETSVVITSIAGLDLSEENITVSHENDKVTYFNQDGSVFDGSNLTYTVNDDILLPNVEQSNFLTGPVDFAGYYEFLAPNGSVVASGDYQNNGVISSDKLVAGGRGEYTLNLTDAYNRTTTVNYKVGAILTAEVSDNYTLTVNGKKYVDGDEIIVYNDDVIVRLELNEGYEVTGYKIDDGDYILKIVGGDSVIEASAVTSKNVFKPQVSAINYTITYEYFDSSITGVPSAQTFTVLDRANGEFAFAAPTAEGKSFTGWFLNGKKITSLNDLALENVTLTGAFGEKKITYTFVVDGEETYRYKFGDESVEYVPVKDGYVFEGWVDEAGNAVDLANASADVKVYAKFTPAGATATGDKETAGVNDGEANIVDADIKQPYYIGVPELISFALVVIGLAGAIVGLVFFLKKNKGAKAVATDSSNENEQNEGEQE